MKLLATLTASLLLSTSAQAASPTLPPEWQTATHMHVSLTCMAYSFSAAADRTYTATFTATEVLNTVRQGVFWRMPYKDEKFRGATKQAVDYGNNQSASAQERQMAYCAEVATIFIGMLNVPAVANLEDETALAYRIIVGKPAK